jgi:hypothetical protein
VRSGVVPPSFGLASRLRDNRGITTVPPSRGASSTATPQQHLRAHGLLARWDDAHYGLELPDPVAAGQLLHWPGLLWDAVQADAAESREAPGANMQRVLEATDRFLKRGRGGAPPELVDHEATLNALRRLGETEGQLLLLTGPRSVGKSLMLKTVAQELEGRGRRVLHVDAREHGADLVQGIVTSITSSRDSTFLTIFH